MAVMISTDFGMLVQEANSTQGATKWMAVSSLQHHGCSTHYLASLLQADILHAKKTHRHHLWAGTVSERVSERWSGEGGNHSISSASIRATINIIAMICQKRHAYVG